MTDELHKHDQLLQFQQEHRGTGVSSVQEEHFVDVQYVMSVLT